ncbi:MAG: type II secretion system F family protein [Candidatus Aenigmarchaeota archaeon]|nr:type II secretion system F family protein [Candidatus Aenigmarchaeota archaeon]
MQKLSDLLKDKDNKKIIYVISISIFYTFLFQIIKYAINTAAVNETANTIMDIFSIFILIIPFSLVIYKIQKNKKETERIFPIFLKDIVEGIRGGMCLPLAIDYAAHNNYGILTPHIKRLAAKISWGIPFEQAFIEFSKSTKSKVIHRSIATIIEVYRSGGKIAEVLDSVGTSAFEIDTLKKEREATIASQLMRGYIIYFIFILVLMGMVKFVPILLVPMSTTIDSAPAEPFDMTKYNIIFLHIAIIEGVFTGLSIGKLAGGSIKDGVSHCVILGLSGYIMLIFLI